MKYYKILNLNRQHMGPFAASQTWLDIAQKEPGFSGTYSNLGECDAKGNPLEEIAKNNFISAPKIEIAPPPPSVPSPAILDASTDDESQYQSFDNSKTTINEGSGTSTGTAEQTGTGKKVAAKKTGGKSGKGK